MTITRTDIHRPSAINPLEYTFVAIKYTKIESLGTCQFLKDQRQWLAAHMEKTGGTWAKHEHGGSCHVCGASALYLAIYYHAGSNEYIVTGFDCADKMDIGEARLFRSAKAAVKTARDFKKGNAKAELTFAEAGHAEVWTVFNWSKEQYADSGMNPAGEWCYITLCDIVGKLVKYGSISDKQMNFCIKLADQCLNFKAVKAEKDAVKAAELADAEAVPVSEDRVTIIGTIVSVKYDANWMKYNMLVKDNRGFKVWGSVPSKIDADEAKGGTVTFDAKVTQSNKDEYFGFFKRPTKVSFEAAAE